MASCYACRFPANYVSPSYNLLDSGIENSSTSGKSRIVRMCASSFDDLENYPVIRCQDKSLPSRDVISSIITAQEPRAAKFGVIGTANNGLGIHAPFDVWHGRDSIQSDFGGISLTNLRLFSFTTVGSIPYRYRSDSDELEVLLITSLNGRGVQFPKGVWGLDETSGGAALRNSVEEAGVIGNLEHKLGKWNCRGESNGTSYEVHMFPLLVNEELEQWQKKNVNQRKWMSVAEARNVCEHSWMRESLDQLIVRFTPSGTQEEETALIAGQNDDSRLIIGSSGIGNSYDVDFEPDNSNGNGDCRTHSRRNGCSQKVSLEWIFVIINFILELPSAIFDQLSSVHAPRYALYAMLLSIAAMFICIVELVYKAWKRKVLWRWRGMLPWFYYPLQNHRPFGTFKDNIGLACALCQCIVTTINYTQADKPIKISVWPIIFASGLLVSKILENPERRAII